MAGYIDLGFIHTGGLADFSVSSVSLLNSLEQFETYGAKFPSDSECQNWLEADGDGLSLSEALERLSANRMAELRCGFKLGHNDVENVLIRVKHIGGGDAYCLLLEMPDKNPVFRNIDAAEESVLEEISRAFCFGFTYAFCDSDADAPDDLSGFGQDEQYSVSARYSPAPRISFKGWKIDGVSARGQGEYESELKEKIYKCIISDVAMEISISNYWRKRIFDLEEDESLSISFEQPEAIPEYVRDAIVRNRLSFLVKKVSLCPEEFDEGLVIFKFWARPFPDICSYSGNKPGVQ